MVKRFCDWVKTSQWNELLFTPMTSNGLSVFGGYYMNTKRPAHHRLLYTTQAQHSHPLALGKALAAKHARELLKMVRSGKVAERCISFQQFIQWLNAAIERG